VGGVFLIIGAWLRMIVVATDSFYPVLGGSVIAAFG